MDFTFGIITAAQDSQTSLAWRDGMMSIFDSIRRQNIMNYEIIVVGGPDVREGRHSKNLHLRPDVVHIPFDDDVVLEMLKEDDNIFAKPGVMVDKDGVKHEKKVNFIGATNERESFKGIASGWITKKKNLITENAKYENIVFLHDYHIFRDDWYRGFLEFGDDWDVCMNRITDIWGNRFRDWVSWDSPTHGRRTLVDYNDDSFIKHCYISGSYWVAKKKFMEENPLDEQFLWGQGEDLEWSFRIRDTFKYKMNQNSTVSHIRPKYTGDEKFYPSFAARYLGLKP
tara:strand:- start:14749 stop:15600 length:852 start_codon:yes stop_codon:yes gene_type:complete